MNKRNSIRHNSVFDKVDDGYNDCTTDKSYEALEENSCSCARKGIFARRLAFELKNESCARVHSYCATRGYGFMYGAGLNTLMYFRKFGSSTFVWQKITYRVRFLRVNL